MIFPAFRKLSGYRKSFNRSFRVSMSAYPELQSPCFCHHSSTTISTGARRGFAKWSDSEDRPAWSEEWKRLNLGAKLVQNDSTSFPSNLFFVQLGFGVDQHGDRTDATKAAIRAVRNAIEFNSIPGVIEHIPGGRKEMLIHVKLGIPSGATVDALQVAKVFPCTSFRFLEKQCTITLQAST